MGRGLTASTANPARTRELRATFCVLRATAASHMLAGSSGNCVRTESSSAVNVSTRAPGRSLAGAEARDRGASGPPKERGRCLGLASRGPLSPRCQRSPPLPLPLPSPFSLISSFSSPTPSFSSNRGSKDDSLLDGSLANPTALCKHPSRPRGFFNLGRQGACVVPIRLS